MQHFQSTISIPLLSVDPIMSFKTFFPFPSAFLIEISKACNIIFVCLLISVGDLNENDLYVVAGIYLKQFVKLC